MNGHSNEAIAATNPQTYDEVCEHFNEVFEPHYLETEQQTEEC